jgi:hypothetical protein
LSFPEGQLSIVAGSVGSGKVCPPSLISFLSHLLFVLCRATVLNEATLPDVLTSPDNSPPLASRRDPPQDRQDLHARALRSRFRSFRSHDWLLEDGRILPSAALVDRSVHSRYAFPLARLISPSSVALMRSRFLLSSFCLDQQTSPLARRTTRSVTLLPSKPASSSETLRSLSSATRPRLERRVPLVLEGKR